MPTQHKTFADKKPQQLVYLELGAGNGGMLLSISEEGFRFRAVTPVRANGTIPFAFALDGTNRLEGNGVIEWVEGDGKSGGLRFTEVSQEFRAALTAWLAADSGSRATGREVTPASAIPLDTMEKIRQELRSGYSARPEREPVSKAKVVEPRVAPKVVEPTVTEKKTKFAERAPVQEVSQPEAKNITAQPKSEPVAKAEVVEPRVESKVVEPTVTENKPKLAERAPVQEVPQQETNSTATERQSVPQAQEQMPSPPVAEQEPKVKESLISKRIFPLPEPAPTTQDPSIPALGASAFLKPAVKAESRPATRAVESERDAEKFAAFLRATPSTALPAAPDVHVPAAEKKPASPRFPTSVFEPPAAPSAASASESSRPFVPSFEESFEHAWEKAKLTAPADSPRVSRAAAATIIAVALGAILGVLAFNYRQDVGGLMIQLGRVISGEDHSAVPSAAAPSPPASETKPETKPAESPTTAGKQPSVVPPRETAENPAGDAKPAPEVKSPPVSSRSKTPSAATRNDSPARKPEPSASSAAPTPNVASANTPVIPADGGTGQEEFGAAREILRGTNRQRDFSKAVDLLWAGVRKGYVPAEVTLGDLFRRGDGIEKNCDQARVLLVAASKKGSSDARQMLEQMAEQGCQ